MTVWKKGSVVRGPPPFKNQPATNHTGAATEAPRPNRRCRGAFQAAPLDRALPRQGKEVRRLVQSRRLLTLPPPPADAEAGAGREGRHPGRAGEDQGRGEEGPLLHPDQVLRLSRSAAARPHAGPRWGAVAALTPLGAGSPLGQGAGAGTWGPVSCHFVESAVDWSSSKLCDFGSLCFLRLAVGRVRRCGTS